MNTAFQSLIPGDLFRISTPRMFASGEVVKVNRVTVSYKTDYQPAPNGPIFHQEGKIPLYYFERTTRIIRGETAFTLL